MVIMDDNKQDPKEFVDKLYKKLIRIHVLDPDWGYDGMTTHAVKEIMRVMVKEMNLVIIESGGVYDDKWFEKVKLYIEAK